jgi:gliding motility-associated-like protein
VLSEPAALTIGSAVTDVKCHGDNNGAIQIIPSGGTTPYSYSWAGYSQISSSLTGLSSGNYVVTVTDANGCTLSSGEYVWQPAGLQAYVTSTAPVCYNTATGTLYATAYGGVAPYAYSWNSSPVQTTATASALVSGVYILTVTDSNGCIYTESDSVAQTAPVSITLTSHDVLCHGGNDGWAYVAVTNPTSSAYSYSWNTSPAQTAVTARGLQPGSYSVTVTSAEGCVATGQVTIAQPQKLVVTASADSVCPNLTQGSAYATASGGQGKYTYTWYTQPVQQANIISSLPVGTYTVVVEDSMGCKDTATATVASYHTTQVQVSGGPELCEGSGLVLTASGSQSYQWTPSNSLSCVSCNAPYASPANNTTYTVLGTDDHGCTSSAQIHLKVIHHEPVSVDPERSICEGESIRLGASGGIEYRWLQPVHPDDSQSPNPTVQPKVTTIYPVIITENQCFTDTLTQTVKVSAKPALELGPDMEASIGETVTLKANASGADKITWSPSEGLSCTDCFAPNYTVLHGTTFIATVETEGGCTATDTVHIGTVCDDHYLYFANVFTPNGDGQNDRFYPQGVDGFPIRTFMVYDRWGEIVFSAHNIGVNDPSAGWDGTFRGQTLKPDVYVYVVDAICSNGKKVAIRGDISLIR